MKKLIGCSLLVLTMAVGIAPAYAHGSRACKGIWKACKKAGKKGDDLKSCVDSFKGGATVDGVTVSTKDAASCKAEGQSQAPSQPAGG